MKPLIRPLEQTDIPAIASWMMLDPHWANYGMTVSSIVDELSGAFDRGELLLTADHEGHPVGFAWCIPNGMFGSAPYLKRIGVEPHMTGSSIGTALMEELEQGLVRGGSRELYLLVGDQNPRAETFYRQRGFEKVGEFPGLAIEGVSEHLYRKDLTALSY